MPRRDGTGPSNDGPLTGKGFGPCSGSRLRFERKRGLGLGGGLRRGVGRRLGRCFYDGKTDKEFLEEKKSFLQDRLDRINKELENL